MEQNLCGLLHSVSCMSLSTQLLAFVHLLSRCLAKNHFSSEDKTTVGGLAIYAAYMYCYLQGLGSHDTKLIAMSVCDGLPFPLLFTF